MEVGWTFSMDSKVQQIALPSTQPAIDNMIPIFIGTSKTNYSGQPVFTDTTYNVIQLTLDDSYIIDPISIIPTITYWKEVSAGTISIVAPTNLITLSIPVTAKFNSNSLFIIYDNENNLLFSSTINNFTYNLNNLISINLDNQLTLTGSLNFKLISKVTEIIPFIYNAYTKQITLQFTSKSNNVSFPNTVTNQSTISYNYTINEIVITTFDPTVDIAANEQNPELSDGLSLLTTQAIIISIPNDSYIGAVIELLKIQTIGYYIVPINLSDTSVTLLNSFIDSTFKSFFVPAANIIISEQLSSGSVIVYYMDEGYVDDHYV